MYRMINDSISQVSCFSLFNPIVHVFCNFCLTLYFDIAHEFLLDKCDCILRNTLEMLTWDLVCRFSSVEPNQAALARE